MLATRNVSLPGGSTLIGILSRRRPMLISVEFSDATIQYRNIEKSRFGSRLHGDNGYTYWDFESFVLAVLRYGHGFTQGSFDGFDPKPKVFILFFDFF